MALSTKQQAIRETAMRLFHGGIGKPNFTLLDRLVYITDQNPGENLKGVTDLISVDGHRVGRPEVERYRRVRTFWWRGTNAQLYLYSEPIDPWLPTFRIRMVADDMTGLLPSQVLAARAAIDKPVVTYGELAWDWAAPSGVNRGFVLRHGVFGKSRRDRSQGDLPPDHWGTWKSGKRTVSYSKDLVCGHRTEIKMRSRFLRKYGIADVEDFWKFERVLPHRHIFFGRILDSQLQKRVRRIHTARRTAEILNVIRKHRGDLDAQMEHLRNVGLKNSRRVLQPLPTNVLVRWALRDWVSMWPKRLPQVGAHDIVQGEERR